MHSEARRALLVGYLLVSLAVDRRPHERGCLLRSGDLEEHAFELVRDTQMLDQADRRSGFSRTARTSRVLGFRMDPKQVLVRKAAALAVLEQPRNVPVLQQREGDSKAQNPGIPASHKHHPS